MTTIKTKSEVKVTVTRKWYATLCNPKMHPHTKFGIPTSKNIGDMHRTRSGTDGWTLRLLYASQSSFGGIKTSETESYETGTPKIYNGTCVCALYTTENLKVSTITVMPTNNDSDVILCLQLLS